MKDIDALQMRDINITFWLLPHAERERERESRRHGSRLRCQQILRYTEKPNKMTEQSLYLTLIFLLSTHKGQYTLCLKMTPPVPAIT